MLSVKALNAYYGTSHVLQGVDLELHDGTILAVLGRNGVGKTTTVRAIMGLVRPSSGHVLLDGKDIAGWAPHRVARAGIAYVPEGRLMRFGRMPVCKQPISVGSPDVVGQRAQCPLRYQPCASGRRS